MLELVLALPILLFIMALIYNYGIVATWKVRENSVARLAVWESRWPRSGPTRPSYWPATATMEASDQGNVAAMDDSRVDLPVARGPLQGATVNAELLDPTRGLCEGLAELTRQYAYLPKMPKYTIDAQTWLIDDKWQYQTPKMGMGNNWLRRIPVIYYPLAAASRSLVNAYTQAVMAVEMAPFRPQLAPLDSDPDFIYYGLLFGWGGAPDFYRSHAWFRPLCTLDHSLTDAGVQDLIDRIQGNNTKRPRVASMAEFMANAFLALYQQALSAFEAILKAKNPPASPQMVALAQSQIPQLHTYIQELEAFLQSIQASSGQ
jgi:hypothetical protein